ncbi:ATP-binding protein [Clostridium sp. MSJ-8]|jgi:predicted kinase|uniref:AAA family ATPase n=1 Tax=Clostridium sp. MSJ-8 TaxID=2841510 RepID=UPI001C0F2596|nr:AAA family ATPase [Clostridium sp. MSJ-8]MBU5487655.1 ATP-binding protein [Clostridium sp. MSJ-8]
MKKLILVTSPPACGKTYISKQLAKAMHGLVYLDKDTLIPLSKQIFKVANQEYNRSSDFFEEYIRNEEYEVVLDLAMEALEYNDNVLINAPFTREIRDKAYIDHLKEVLKERDAKLVIVWVITDKEVCHQRMIERASDRDKWKLDNWDEYIASCNFDIPDTIMDPEDDLGLLLFHNSSEEEFNASLKEISEKLINS